MRRSLNRAAFYGEAFLPSLVDETGLPLIRRPHTPPRPYVAVLRCIRRPRSRQLESYMRQEEFVALIDGVVVWPLTVRAQRPGVPPSAVGVLTLLNNWQATKDKFRSL